MKVGMLDVDSHNFPNLALMKLSAWHKACGDTVEMWNRRTKGYDLVYMSKVFDETYSPDLPEPMNAKMIIKGGTGYGLDNKLPSEVEHIMPDYALYGNTDTAYGFLSRGCPRACPFCIVSEKEGRKSIKVADLSEWWNGQPNITLLDPNLTACKERIDLLKQLSDSGATVLFNQGLDVRLIDEEFVRALNTVKVKMIHFAWDLMNQSDDVLKGLYLYKRYGRLGARKTRVYVLTNFNTTMEENLYRIYELVDLGFDPFVMVFDKPNAPPEILNLQRWVNNKRIFHSCKKFEDYGHIKLRRKTQ